MIQVRGLTKYYGEHAAIRDLDFDIETGEVVGFLGLNGAGKSTTLKILSCVLLPTSGRVTVDGRSAIDDAHEVRGRIGFLPDTPPLYNEMTVGRYLSFAAQLRGISASEAPKRVAEAEEKTALQEVHDELISALSHGYRQRVGLAQALVHRPSLLILDEPTSGLDPVQIVEMRNLIKALRGEHTLLISSHFLAEISQTCDRLLVIQQGEIVAQGSENDLANLMERAGESEITVRGDSARAAQILEQVHKVTKVQKLAEVGTEVTFRVSAPLDLRADLARAIVGGGLDLLQMGRASSRLESVFLELTADRNTPADGRTTGDVAS